MAFPSTFHIFTLFFITTFAIPSTALITSGILGGVVSCISASAAIEGKYPPIAQAKVDLVCGADSYSFSSGNVVKSVLTNTAGLYSFVIRLEDGILNDPGKCYLRVNMPHNSCKFDLPTGSLLMPVVVLKTIDALLGKILVLAPGTPSYVPNV